MYIMRALEYLCCAPCRTVFWIICCTPGVGGAPVREREYTLFVGNCSAPYQNKPLYIYSEKQKTVEYKDDIKEIIKCFWCFYNAYSFTSNSLNNLLSKIGQFTVAVSLKFFPILMLTTRSEAAKARCTTAGYSKRSTTRIALKKNCQV